MSIGRRPKTAPHEYGLANHQRMVRLQAAVMSYADVFLMMAVLFLALAAFGLLMKRPQAVAAAEH